MWRIIIAYIDAYPLCWNMGFRKSIQGTQILYFFRGNNIGEMYSFLGAHPQWVSFGMFRLFPVRGWMVGILFLYGVKSFNVSCGSGQCWNQIFL